MSTQYIPDSLSGTIEAVPIIAERRTGKRPSPATIWRWCRKGVRHGSIKLQAIFHSGCWQTTPAAFDEFLAAQTEAAMSELSEPESASDDDLRAAGLL